MEFSYCCDSCVIVIGQFTEFLYSSKLTLNYTFLNPQCSSHNLPLTVICDHSQPPFMDPHILSFQSSHLATNCRDLKFKFKIHQLFICSIVVHQVKEP